MMRFALSLVGSLISAAMAVGMATASEVVKSEFRSAWITTGWTLDWPAMKSSAEQQKRDIDRMLDSLSDNHFNAVNFKVRALCDAMYASGYDPWSYWLTGTRGKEPGYDPLQHVVEGCHKRGMECHAWVNPYRFSTGEEWDTDIDNEVKASGHLLSFGGVTILNPAHQWTITRIVNVCREIVNNYDVDGLLFDDFFYPNGIPCDSTACDYPDWQESGTTKNMGDWRRDNVNRMVKSVYDMIQATKPWVRFGISPAGVACSDSDLANRYGIDPCPGSDWQYDGIFSNPIAWLADEMVDYISPQVYWPIGYSAADYAKITPWWGKVAKKFNRHVFISHKITFLTPTSVGKLTSGLEAYTPTDTLYDEYVNEVVMNRHTNLNNAPGSVFYSCKFLYALGAKESFAHYLKRTVYHHLALPPAMAWKNATEQGIVSNLNKEAYTLSWDAKTNVRYTVYAIPDSIKPIEFEKDAQCLIGISYTPQFTIPAPYRTGHRYAICVLDRYGNEYAPAFLEPKDTLLSAPKLITPEDGATLMEPFSFVWHRVEGASQYAIEVANDADFKTVTHTFATADTCVASMAIEGISSDTIHYWRVCACAIHHGDGISHIRKFTPHRLEVIHPTHHSEDVNNDPTIRWTNTKGENATVEIAYDSIFSDNDIVFSYTSHNNQAKVPLYILHSGKRYYVRVITEADTSKTVEFTTLYRSATPPEFAYPSGIDTILHSHRQIELVPQIAAENMVIEISNSPTIWGRTRYVETLINYQHRSSEYLGKLKVNGAPLVDGNTYYVRAKASFVDTGGSLRNTDYCTPTPFIYKKNQPSGDINGDGVVNVSDVTALVNHILGAEAYSESLCDVNADGEVNVSDVTALVNLIL